MDTINAKSILSNSKDNGWFGIDYKMNLYRGCCHGCIYCDSRSDCYQIEDFDTVRIKKDCSLILEKELMTKKSRGVVGIGAMSDTYNPFEKKYEYTRKALELLVRYGFGVSIETKSDLITRDIDLFQAMNASESCILKLTITTPDDALSRIIEPNVCPSSRRLKAVEQLSRAGIYTGIIVGPVLPYITSSVDDILRLVRYAYDSGAKFVYAMFAVTLRSNQRIYYYDRLNESFPSLSRKYIREYGNAYACIPSNEEELYQAFKEECEKLGLVYKMKDIIKAYKKPDPYKQLSLFDMFEG